MNLIERIEITQDQLRGEYRSKKLFRVMFMVLSVVLMGSIILKAPLLIPIAAFVASSLMLLKCKIGVGSLCLKIEKMKDCYTKGSPV